MSAAIVGENIDILKLVYDNVTVIGDRRIVAVTKDRIVLLDTNGNQLYDFDKQSSKLCGTFVVQQNLNESSITLTSLKTDRQMKLGQKDMVLCTIDNIVQLGDEFICIDNIVRKTIVNSQCDTVVNLYYVSNMTVYEETDTRCIIHYKSVHDSTDREAILDKHTGKYISLDRLKVSEKYDLVGTSQAKRNCTYHYDSRTFSAIRYTLYKGDIPVGVEYIDIRLVNDSDESGYAYVFEHIGGKVYQGIMNISTGEEEIPPSYKGINEFGNNVFILYDENGVMHIYDIRKGYLFTNLTEQNIKKHSVLPIVVVFKDSKYSIVDKNGDVYDFVDFAKHWDCEYCTDNTNIIRVTFRDECGVRQKYMDTQLTEITNKNLIAELSNKEWVKLG